MNRKAIFLCFFFYSISSQTSPAQVTIDGRAFLKNQTRHDSIKVRFERIAPTLRLDSTFTDISGYFSIQLESGIYNITHSKTQYYPFFLIEIPSYSDQTLEDVILSKNLIYVNDNIQAAIDMVANGDTVMVADGVYKGNGNFGLKWDGNVKHIVLMSENGPDNCIIDGDGAAISAFNFDETNQDSTDVIKGFKVAGFLKSAIYLKKSSPRFTDMILKNNSTRRSFGFRDGGAIHCWESNAEFHKIEVNNNEAEQHGGGLYLLQSDIKINQARISGNKAGVNGGGILCLMSKLKLINVEMNENVSGRGGAIYCDDSEMLLEGSVINENRSGEGAGIYIGGSAAELVNTTFVSNTGSLGAIYASIAKMTNCIVAYNNAQYGYNNIGPEAPSIIFSDFFSNQMENFGNPGKFIGKLITINVNGDSADAFLNIQRDPGFVDLSTGDYRLLSDSPCINAGNPDSPPDPDGTVADMGAFFRHKDAPVISVADTSIEEDTEFNCQARYSGIPSPTFSLIDSPDNMTISSESGNIS
jgi:hypothetical protein